MLTLEQKACNFDTMRHIERVRNLLNLFVVELLRRLDEGNPVKENPDEMTLLDIASLFSVRSEITNLAVVWKTHFSPQVAGIIRNTERIPGLSRPEFSTGNPTEIPYSVLLIFARDLLRRGEEHDQSKLESPEVELFTEFTPKLSASTYGSAEYESFRVAMKPALDHHYAKNSHHPEHFKSGINDMSLSDVMELFCDWKAASERHHSGNILKSIEINADRFGMSPQLVRILENTAKMFD